MNKVQRHKTVTYTPHEMFDLVNDVDAYSDFLPWCSDSQTIKTTPEGSTASITMALGKIKHKFTTNNRVEIDTSINMTLIDGPFKYLTGNWLFESENNGGSTISITMEFEFKSAIHAVILNKAFSGIITSLTNAFHERAIVIYGKRN